MPRNTLGTNFNLCFTKLKRPLPLQSSDHNNNNNLNEHHQQQHHSMYFCNSIKNFNSLYDLSSECNSNTYSATIPDESDYIYESDTTTPDLATIYASQRFFFSTPGHSNSIIDSSSSSLASTSTSSSLESDAPIVVVDGSIAIPIPTDSPDPYLDFRRSMQEMVEARGLSDMRGNWESLHQLLMCYLTLNPKSTHKYIVGAFSDLIVCLMASKSQHLDPSAGSTSKSCSQKCILDYYKNPSE